MKKAPAGFPPEKVALYDRLIATIPNVERKGVDIPYTSVNGHMFSYLSRTGVMALRLAAAKRESFLKKYHAKLLEQYGIVQKNYVEVPDALLENTLELKPFFGWSYAYVNSLKPKPITGYRGKQLQENEEPVPENFAGEVVEHTSDGYFEVQLDDGRVLPYCYIDNRDVGRLVDFSKLLPKIGDRVWAEEDPYHPGHAFFVIHKRWPAYGSSDCR